MHHLICMVVHGIGTIHEASNKKQKIAVENVFRFLCILSFYIFMTSGRSKWSFLERKRDF